MKIFYAVQATGNGHISRAMSLLPHLQQFGTVDIFLSGSNAHLPLDGPVKYRSKGISLFYNCNGGIDYWEMMKKINLISIKKEIRDLPVEKYDLVLNDFDYITSAACARKNIPSIHFGHQASFSSLLTPRPEKKSRTGEWILTHFVKAPFQAGYHFEKYDDHIFEPVVKKEIVEAIPSDNNHITVYLPSYCESQLTDLFSRFSGQCFQVFSREARQIRTVNNLTFIPVDNALFTQSLIGCSGIICGGGFETPAEALHLGKKILAIPIAGQYEQQCNVAALCKMGVPTLAAIGPDFPQQVETWLNSRQPALQRDYSSSISTSLDYLFSLPVKRPNQLQEHLSSL